MPAYLIAQVRVDDRETYQEYAARSPAIISQYGGRILARGGATEVLEGYFPGGRVVIVEFASMEAAKLFYESSEYREIRKIRESASEASFLIVDGV